MPHVNKDNFPEIKFALLFLHTTENTFFYKTKAALNERKEHSQRINKFGFKTSE